jgi:hypothetical protein
VKFVAEKRALKVRHTLVRVLALAVETRKAWGSEDAGGMELCPSAMARARCNDEQGRERA